MARLYTIHELADLVHVHPKTISNWIAKGKIQTINLAGEILIPEEEAKKAHEISKKTISERMREDAKEKKIPHLYKLCSDGKFEQLMNELGLQKKPKTTRDCFSIISQYLKERKKPKTI